MAAEPAKPGVISEPVNAVLAGLAFILCAVGFHFYGCAGVGGALGVCLIVGAVIAKLTGSAAATREARAVKVTKVPDPSDKVLLNALDKQLERIQRMAQESDEALGRKR